MAKFIVKGPIEVPTKKQAGGGKHIDQSGVDKLVEKHATLEKMGCYIFSLKAGKGSKPLYVGKTARTIIKEAFSDRNRLYVGIKFSEHRRGTLQIWTITPVGRGRAPVNEIKDIEKEITEIASIKNPDLINTQNRAKKRNWSIEGVVQPKPGPRSTEAKGFRKMVGIGD